MAERQLLISLQIRGFQAQPLVDGYPISTPPAAAATAASPLAAMLAGLQRLSIKYGYNEPDVLGVGRLVGACSSLTRLQLRGGTLCRDRSFREFTHLQQDANHGATLMEALQQAAPASASGTAGCLLPHLRHLEVAEGSYEVLHTWIERLELSGLTSLAISNIFVDDPVDLSCLAACPGLQELLLERHGKNRRWAVDPLQLTLPDGLTQATCLTKLVLGYNWGGGWWGDDSEEVVPPVVWELTQLLHLDIHNWRLEQTPEQVSTLKQLTHLSVKGTGLGLLPSDLGTLLPQLQVLDVSMTEVEAIPELPRLTCLYAGDSQITSMSAVSHLVLLRELHQHGYNPMKGALDGITKLANLEVLELGIKHATIVGPSNGLPRLRHVNIKGEGGGDNPLQVASRLLGSAGQLTYLSLNCITAGQVEELQQLGVLPVLQELHMRAVGGASLMAASAWLQQQPHLTALHLSKFDLAQLGVLPAQLLSLFIRAMTDTVISSPSLEESLVPLTNLRSLEIDAGRYEHGPGLHLPAWLSTFQHLQEFGCDHAIPGWEVLQQLPVLRRIGTGVRPVVPLLCAAPHLCWAGWS
jgi:Leucine-rich repeat (LRR) protein